MICAIAETRDYASLLQTAMDKNLNGKVGCDAWNNDCAAVFKSWGFEIRETCGKIADLFDEKVQEIFRNSNTPDEKKAKLITDPPDASWEKLKLGMMEKECSRKAELKEKCWRKLSQVCNMGELFGLTSRKKVSRTGCGDWDQHCMETWKKSVAEREGCQEREVRFKKRIDENMEEIRTSNYYRPDMMTKYFNEQKDELRQKQRKGVSQRYDEDGADPSCMYPCEDSALFFDQRMGSLLAEDLSPRDEENHKSKFRDLAQRLSDRLKTEDIPVCKELYQKCWSGVYTKCPVLHASDPNSEIGME